MARIAGIREDEVEDKAQISALGSEGQLSFVTETWKVTGVSGGIDRVTANDELESRELKVPGGSKILSVVLTRNQALAAAIQYRDLLVNSAFGTWTQLVAGAAGTTELTVNRNHASLLETLNNHRFFRVKPTATLALAPGITLEATLYIIFGNI